MYNRYIILDGDFVFIAQGSPGLIITTSGINRVAVGACAVYLWYHVTQLKRAAVQTFDLLVELLHSVAHGRGETFNNVAHHTKVCHVVDVSFLRRRGDGLQLILISVFHTWRQRG